MSAIGNFFKKIFYSCMRTSRVEQEPAPVEDKALVDEVREDMLAALQLKIQKLKDKNAALKLSQCEDDNMVDENVRKLYIQNIALEQYNENLDAALVCNVDGMIESECNNLELRGKLVKSELQKQTGGYVSSNSMVNVLITLGV